MNSTRSRNGSADTPPFLSSEPGDEANASSTRASRKKWASSGFASGTVVDNRTIQMKLQMSRDRNPRTVPIGKPNG